MAAVTARSTKAEPPAFTPPIKGLLHVPPGVLQAFFLAASDLARYVFYSCLRNIRKGWGRFLPLNIHDQPLSRSRVGQARSPSALAMRLPKLTARQKSAKARRRPC